jgi:hypothetical protein
MNHPEHSLIFEQANKYFQSFYLFSCFAVLEVRKEVLTDAIKPLTKIATSLIPGLYPSPSHSYFLLLSA